MADYKIRIIVEGEDRASGPLAGVTGSLQRMGEVAGGMLLAKAFGAITSGASAMGASLVSAVQDAGGLEAQIDGIGAVSGASAMEMAGLAELINDLGINPNLKVSTYEAADAIEMLVRNGMALEDVFGGAAEQTVLLANSTGADFAAAADIATDAMAIFGIGAGDMATAVDGITGVVASSKFSIYDYQLALAQGGAAAAVAGVSFEDFNTAVAAVASNFASGSDAGTSLKTMIQRLVPQSKEAAGAMADLGLEFFNADGSMRDMAEIAGELNRAFSGLSEEQRISYLTTIFGTDAMRAAAGMANYTAEEYEALQARIGDTDALRAAQQRMNNLSGDVEIFGGVLEAVKLQIGASFMEPARVAVQGLTSVLSQATPILLSWAEQAAAWATPYVESVVGTLTDPQWQADVAGQVQAFWDNYTTNNRIAFNLGDVLEVDFSLDGAGEGITKFKLSDFFEFYSEDGAIEKIYLDQVIDFENREGITKLSIFDIFDFESTEGGPVKWNVKDLVSFEGIGEQEFTLRIGAFEYTSQPEGEYTVTGWTFNGKGPGDLLSDASSGLGQALADLSATSGFDALLAQLAEPITMTLAPEWQGEAPEAQMNRLTGQTWTVKVLGTWEFEMPEWLRTGSMALLVHLKAEGLPGLGGAAAGAVASALGGMNWSLPKPQIDWSFLEFKVDWESTGFSEWFQGQTVDAPQVKWEGAGFAEWFAAQTFTLPLPGALSDGKFTIEGADVLEALQSWSWPALPSWSWPTLPAWSWPEIPVFQWPDLPLFSWPALPSWSWPEMPKFSWPEMPRFSWPSLPAWSWPTLPAWSWPEIPVFQWPTWSWPEIPVFQWPDLPLFSWPALPSWSWPEMPKFSWPEMPRFSWPSLPAWSWPTLPAWSWPEIPVPGWLAGLFGSGGGGAAGATPPGKAVGGPAGGRTWVGEFGPEVVDLPRGSYVHTAGASRRLAAVGEMQQVFHFAPVINTPLDMEEALRRLADLARRRGGW